MATMLTTMLMMFVFDAVVVAIRAGFGFSVHWHGLLLLAVLLGLLMIILSAFSIATALLTMNISSFAATVNGINLPAGDQRLPQGCRLILGQRGLAGG
jgi:hypothetical protein